MKDLKNGGAREYTIQFNSFFSKVSSVCGGSNPTHASSFYTCYFDGKCAIRYLKNTLKTPFMKFNGMRVRTKIFCRELTLK